MQVKGTMERGSDIEKERERERGRDGKEGREMEKEREERDVTSWYPSTTKAILVKLSH
jgi:hypothetical protein